MIRSLVVLFAFAGLVVAQVEKKDEKKEYRPENDKISDYVDNPEKYVGKTLTFRVTFAGGNSLKERVGDKGVPFKGVDPNNGAKLLLGLIIPRGLEVPNAKDDEEVIVTFQVQKFDNMSNGKAVAIRRPNTKDKEAELKGKP